MEQRICTSIEQSKKLIELGIDINTADMFWAIIKSPKDNEARYACHVLNTWENEKYENLLERQSTRLSFVPAWSLNALLKIITVLNFTIKCENNKFNIDIPERHCKVWFPSLIDAAFEMVYWCLKNNKTYK